MKAWEIAKKIVDDAPVVIRQETAEDWEMNASQRVADSTLRALWLSFAPGSGAPSSLMAGAVQSMENMGYDVSGAETLLRAGLKARETDDLVLLHRITAQLAGALATAPKIPEHPYWNYRIYETFDEVAEDSHYTAVAPVRLDSNAFRAQLKLSWLGQIAGGAFGTAIEGYSGDQIRAALDGIDGYLKPISLYNDDITYELAFLKALNGDAPFSSGSIAEEWAARIPYGWSAEDIALKNIALGILPPLSGKLHNPYREWIGAQMRGAVCGYVAPGNARRAAQLAFLDGCVSHHNNGIIGEIFNAVLTSLAFVENDVRMLLAAAARAVPSKSEFKAVVSYAMECCGHMGAENALQACAERFEQYNLTHAYPNAAIEIVALWFGRGDFDETMRIAAYAGQDVDCNTAMLGAVLGAMEGACIRPKWLAPIGDTLITYVRGIHEVKIDTLVELCIEGAKKLKVRGIEPLRS